MKKFSIFRVDGQPVPVPDADVKVTGTDLDSADSGRDESGLMHRILVRSRVRTWEFSYSILGPEEYACIRSLFAGKAQFQFSFPDENGKTAVTTAYCSQDSIVYRNLATGDYRNLSFKIIEC